MKTRDQILTQFRVSSWIGVPLSFLSTRRQNGFVEPRVAFDSYFANVEEPLSDRARSPARLRDIARETLDCFQSICVFGFIEVANQSADSFSSNQRVRVADARVNDQRQPARHAFPLLPSR